MKTVIIRENDTPAPKDADTILDLRQQTVKAFGEKNYTMSAAQSQFLVRYLALLQSAWSTKIGRFN